MEIITNNQERPILSWWELTDAEREEFDYCGEEDSFIRYRGETIPLCDFMAVDPARHAPNSFASLADWHGYRADSYFSAVLLRYTDDYEGVICGLALS